ncbi:MAG: hypothetical protein IMY86_13925 [Chloroflexi bacterium]|nr:hypothetical protein [Chloroflexota bacterium]
MSCTVDEMLARISSAELAERIALAILRSEGAEQDSARLRADAQVHGQLAQMTGRRR